MDFANYVLGGSDVTEKFGALGKRFPEIKAKRTKSAREMFIGLLS